MKRSQPIFRFLPVVAACIAGPALATNGYFAHGYGLKAKGMGGASTALAQDSLGGAPIPPAWCLPAAAWTSAPTCSCPSATPNAAARRSRHQWLCRQRQDGVSGTRVRLQPHDE